MSHDHHEHHQPHSTHPEIIKRLRRANGHLAKVITMIEAGRGCTDIAQQLQAVSKAIISAKAVFIQDHIDGCLSVENLQTLPQQKQAIAEFREITKYLS